MKRNINLKRLGVAAGLCLVCALPAQDAFARGGDRDGGRGGAHREVVTVGRSTYHYRDGRFYRPSFFGFEFRIGTPPMGAVVTFLPERRRAVIVRGATYYYCDNVYYTSCPFGYAVVPEPAREAAYVSGAIVPQNAAGQAVTVNIPNSNGSFTPVTLVKTPNGYIGPQGEYYAGNPSVDQLRALYGK